MATFLKIFWIWIIGSWFDPSGKKKSISLLWPIVRQGQEEDVEAGQPEGGQTRVVHQVEGRDLIKPYMDRISGQGARPDIRQNQGWMIL